MALTWGEAGSSGDTGKGRQDPSLYSVLVQVWCRIRKMQINNPGE